ncbi:MAG: hypothetical protein N3I86_00440 [Verrucomicrobiae bacterium]|nr:hypothetical protein [Verrucomicrobiae bacterium]
MIQEMLFSSEKPPLSAGGTNRQPTKFFLVHWQSPLRFVMTIASSLDDLTNTSGVTPSRTWYSASEARWWELKALQTNEYHLRVWDTATPSDPRRNPVVMTVNTARYVNLDHVLKLGIAYAPRVGLVWRGNLFSYTNQMEKTIGSGHVVRDDAGRVKTLFHTFSRPIELGTQTEIRTWRHRIDYAYDGLCALSMDFPSGFDMFVLREDAPRFFNERIRFYRVVFSEEPLPESRLAFEPIVRGHQVVRWITTNDTEFVFDGNQLRPVPEPSLFETSMQVSRRARVFVVVMLLASTILLALLWARREKNAAQH